MSSATSDAGSERLYDRTFITLCAAVFLGFCCFGIVNPVLPIVILEQGGDAFLVGIIVAVYSIPSILLRPFMGRLVDEWSRWKVILFGAAGLGLSSFLYLLPGLGFMAMVRILNGSSFAAFNTGGTASLAALAPNARRGEAAAIYNLMPSLAYMIAPAIGLLLLGAFGAGPVFVAAGSVGVLGAAVIALGPLRRVAFAAAPSRRITWRNLLERSAVLPMLIEYLWVSTNVLFFIYPPVWADARGIAVSELALYYPVVGAVLVISRVVIGRRLDRFTRGIAVLIGAGGGVIGILLASVSDTVLVLTIAGAIFSASSSFISPTAAAMAIDRADPQRRGGAMATYSMGFPLGNGTGALVWGAVIAVLGFPVPWFLALLTMAGISALVWSARDELLRPRAIPSRDHAQPG
jgi:MFS family permease